MYGSFPFVRGLVLSGAMMPSRELRLSDFFGMAGCVVGLASACRPGDVRSSERGGMIRPPIVLGDRFGEMVSSSLVWVGGGTY